MKPRLLSGLMLAFVCLSVATPLWAHGEEGQEALKVLQEQQISNAPGKKVIMLTVSYKPGQHSLAHQHPGAVMAYVLEGAVVSQLKGEEPKTFKKGEYWYEAPGTVHLMSRNASNTQPARLLVWGLVDEPQPLTEPYKP
ncbi:cupin domain-containing protein [Pseudomonas fontis]|uniref:Cupin domain-containing protein n=1 Tax=Pseudomonas fontis TaxID=2942633 RepID=A0ABT5P0H4_9PSED|nr:cupin domain-containing protein [Pseudomonas fontis]MDD0977691.1 cupin domain-containing protein [Pseudomonas fontis]MDD0993956.1 cupin domain-containing protein [Pseudomonas fontis]